MPSKKKSNLINLPEGKNKDSPIVGSWTDRFLTFQTHFGRFIWDFLGIAFITLGLLLIVGLSGISTEIIPSELTEIVTLWVGWGIILVIAILIYSGVSIIKQGRDNRRIDWKRFLWLEVFGFLSLAVISIIGGNLKNSNLNELIGGRIGWSLVLIAHNVLGILIGNILIIGLWIISIISSFGGWEKIESWLKKQAGDISEYSRRDRTVQSKDHATTKIHPNKKNLRSTDQVRKKALINNKKVKQIPDLKKEKKFIAASRSDLLPPLNLLIDQRKIKADERNINQAAGLLEKTLADFGIPAKVVGYRVGPTITQFAVEPGFYDKGDSESGNLNRQKVRISQIAGLSRDLALALSAKRLRIEAPVPGKSYVGVEVPNIKAETVRLKPILEADAFLGVDSKLAIALGRDVSGLPVVMDLTRMPHLLIAGTTGSGKSVCISSIAVCLAMNNSPEDLRMIMIDSKMVELIRFNGLPHLYGKVETNVERIMGVLRWTVIEMEVRYKLLEKNRVRDLEAYNKKILKRKDGKQLPRIVVLIDELADLMMSSPDQTEHNLVRLAQMARATGIHLVVATQRPSTEVVTGVIKANFPARISFAVSSGVDSRVILDTSGAETLLGNGDMLFLNPEVGNPIRAQGVLVSDKEIDTLITFWQDKTSKKDVQPPWENVLNKGGNDADNLLIDRAIELIKKEKSVSASLLQRRLRIGYPRAARLLDRLEEMGVVGTSIGGGKGREVITDLDSKEKDNENEND
ncbi:DNA translocase FtsK [Chloroflexota bacterium]